MSKGDIFLLIVMIAVYFRLGRVQRQLRLRNKQLADEAKKKVVESGPLEFVNVQRALNSNQIWYNSDSDVLHGL